ncbi:MAG: hypothetical protein WC372_09290 [Candidatus Neomarinimicrobiota bacterium]|jgi:hypothetical protein
MAIIERDMTAEVEYHLSTDHPKRNTPELPWLFTDMQEALEYRDRVKGDGYHAVLKMVQRFTITTNLLGG